VYTTGCLGASACCARAAGAENASMDMSKTVSVERQSMRLIIVFFSPDFWLVGRAIGTVWFDLDFCLAHRMLVLLQTQ
jgi:hypothetical protein